MNNSILMVTIAKRPFYLCAKLLLLLLEYFQYDIRRVNLAIISIDSKTKQATETIRALHSTPTLEE